MFHNLAANATVIAKEVIAAVNVAAAVAQMPEWKFNFCLNYR